MPEGERKPLVSLIIPVYNTAGYLEECLDSAAFQEYENLEIITVDDGSTDGSGQILERYGAKDSRFRVIHTGNRGLSAARNTALDAARGEYIAFLDSDDRMERDAIGTLVRALQQVGADIAACRAYHDWINETEISRYPSGFAVFGREEACLELLRERFLRNGVWNKLYKAEVFEEIRFPDGRVFEDIATTYRLMDKAEKVVCIPDVLFHYRMRKGSISHVRSFKNEGDRWLAYSEMYSAWNGKGEQFRKTLIRYCMFAIRRMWFSYPVYLRQAEPGERARIKALFHEMQVFSASHRREILKGDFPRRTKITCMVSQCDHPLWLRLLHGIYSARNALKKTEQTATEKILFP